MFKKDLGARGIRSEDKRFSVRRQFHPAPKGFLIGAFYKGGNFCEIRRGNRFPYGYKNVRFRRAPVAYRDDDGDAAFLKTIQGGKVQGAFGAGRQEGLAGVNFFQHIGRGKGIFCWWGSGCRAFP